MDPNPRSRAPVRADGGHGAAAHGRSEPGTRCRRGRMPGARRTARRARRGRSRAGGASASILERTSARSATPGRSSPATEWLAARVRALREHGQTASTARGRGLHRATRHGSGCRAAQKLPLLSAWTEERRRSPAHTPRRSLAWATCCFRPCRRKASRSGTCTRSEPGEPTSSPRSSSSTESRPGGITRTSSSDPAFAHLGHWPGAFPVSEALALELVSLPIYPGLGESTRRRRDGDPGVLRPWLAGQKRGPVPTDRGRRVR